jgi:hypothetical protein
VGFADLQIVVHVIAVDDWQRMLAAAVEPV